VTLSPDSRRTLLETIETQRFGCEMTGSPLYVDLLDVVAADVRAGGVFARLLEPVAEAPFGDAVVLRLLGALHLLVLDGRAPQLARHYPSVGGHRMRGLGADARATAEAHEVEIAARMQGGVQTNEVGRSAALLGGYLELARGGLPLRLFEVGSSAGLNLNVDRYRYRGANGSFGPTESELVFDQPWSFGEPDLSTPLVIVERRGSDIAPVDATSEAGQLRLRSFVWGDQVDRLTRLDAALAVARRHPPVVDQADAPGWLAERLVTPVPGTCTVVTHSIMFQYLSVKGRSAMLRAIESAGVRATDQAPFAWLRLEPGGDQAELRLTAWPGGSTRVLATSSYHGPPVVWRAPASPGMSGGAPPGHCTPPGTGS
jgi:hypothetical protein